MRRRVFISTSLLVSSSFLMRPYELIALASNNTKGAKNPVKKLTISLLERWCKALYDLQTVSPGNPATDGGIFSPGDNAYPGRCADAIYPFLWMARHTGDKKYAVAAIKVYDWEQNNCWNEEYGCWYNNPGEPDGWKSISVFSAITKMESIEHYGDLLGANTIAQWKRRLHRVAEYLFTTFHIGYANINYPATATYALYKLGKLLEEKKYIDKAAILADGILDYFTPEGLFFGEGGREVNKSGQFPVDLGYNVEESLPALAMYSQLSGNKKLHEKVLHSMKVHLEFMLPNGAWDNSWGTRSFKWTIWGSRTSDGCHPGYYLMSEHEPVFLEAVHRNLKCLNDSTYNNVLYSGPHEYLEKIAPSIHHTFDHAKALVKLLHMMSENLAGKDSTNLPREKEYGVKHYHDIDTILFSKGPWRGTIAAYNVNYKDKLNGHPSGGALSCFYHMKLGMLGAASMTEYQRWEKQNMLDSDEVDHFMCLTPRIELTSGKHEIYRNINDYNTKIQADDNGDELIVMTESSLVNGHQEQPPSGPIRISVVYKMNGDTFSISLGMDKKQNEGKLKFIFPVVCSDLVKIKHGSNSFKFIYEKGNLNVRSNYPLTSSIPVTKRVYNFVPGLQAYPIEVDCSELPSEELVLRFSANNT